MMIEPPGDFGRARIFEIDDRVLVAVEFGFVEKSPRAVQQAGIQELNIVTNALGVEPGKQSCRGGTVETTIVIEDFNFQEFTNLLD